MAGKDGDRADDEHSEQSENGLSGNILRTRGVNKVITTDKPFVLSLRDICILSLVR